MRAFVIRVEYNIIQCELDNKFPSSFYDWTMSVSAYMDSEVPLGIPIPLDVPHAISVSVPKWHYIIDREKRDKNVINRMQSGYPRFFIHPQIAKLASICQRRYALENERCMLFATQNIANHCRTFIQERLTESGLHGTIRVVKFLLLRPDDLKKISGSPTADIRVDLYIVVVPEDAFLIAKEFWQYTGLGISSRRAEKYLSLLSDSSSSGPGNTGLSNGIKINGHNGYDSTEATVPSSTQHGEELNPNHSEERHNGKFSGSVAKSILKARIAQGLVANQAPGQTLFLSAEDVYLYPSGMAAIWAAHRLLLDVRLSAKSVCFGFPYMDTILLLRKLGPGCHFLGYGSDDDIDELERILKQELELNPEKPPVAALFTEFPSNPLLRSVNLSRLRALADTYDFPIVVDDTIGNYANVHVFPYADIVVTSLSKAFSGEANVLGGSLALNPQGRHYNSLKNYLNKNFENLYFDEDAIYMEINSRDFKRRLRVMDANAEVVCDFLQTRSIAGGMPNSVLKKVFYPKYITRDNYDAYRKVGVDPEDGKVGGFGGLFSLTFTSMAASMAFYDALRCFKGPSFGTNFTLACPYTIISHFKELDWANRYDVEAGLVRVSVGMEEPATLLSWMKAALDAADACKI